jgi:hypothetical protein
MRIEDGRADTVPVMPQRDREASQSRPQAARRGSLDGPVSYPGTSLDTKPCQGFVGALTLRDQLIVYLYGIAASSSPEICPYGGMSLR